MTPAKKNTPSKRISPSHSKPTIILGFPGFGLVGSIVTEFMTEHLKTSKHSSIILEELQPVIAIHDHKAVEPISVYYNKTHNLYFIHAITPINGLEWKIADKVLALAKAVSASRIICIEGAGLGPDKELTKEQSLFCYCTDEKDAKAMETQGVKKLKEGYIIGIIPALLLRATMPITCIFAPTHSEYPDSKAAASVVELLDKQLDLQVNSAPLLDMAKRFEDKIRTLMSKSRVVNEPFDKKKLSYVG
ncbi:hypothetical protein COY28_00920 [Candidatus Woesearchaeota archaeon CG_4_10_14_0_2_um_filter_57_5]|nr:MAG: hypothetical protein AUJ68_00595 [Candidatus Woesearchaeota archaeon CG1_02_57_44]PIZ56482.1 MAG: hypothetical protein COY28_00920 [Candidatus Woesearchaeota archaeon CG_4_10_14_0_2_um_filter_57_5]